MYSIRQCVRTGGPMLAIAVLLASPALAQSFSVGPVTAAPGTIASGTLTVAPKAGSDDGTSIPISIIHGTKPGPVLALTAGVHGQEYTPVLALQRLLKSTDPKTLTGTIVLVHVANMPSFLARTIYYSPADGKNLNRVFPGKADGTLSERIALTITREVIERATHVIDLHCGDGNESLRPYTYWITTGAPAVAEAGKQMALAFGMDHIVVDRERPADANASVYLSNTAITRGKPALTIESGGMARHRRGVDRPHRAGDRGRAAASRHARGRPAAGGTADLDSAQRGAARLEHRYLPSRGGTRAYRRAGYADRTHHRLSRQGRRGDSGAVRR